MDLFAQFEIAAEEVPSALNTLSVVESLAERRVLEGQHALLHGPFYASRLARR